MLSRSSSAAITAMGALAQRYALGQGPLTSVEIADRITVPQPFVAKLLGVLARRGLVRGSRGRHGGYCLARDPSETTLADVAGCFERAARLEECPFGIGRCGERPPCPLHGRLAPVRAALRRFLEQTTLAHMTVRDPGAVPPRAPRRPRSGAAKARARPPAR